MVFEYLTESLHDLLYKRPRRRFEEAEMKRVALIVLRGLVTMHEEGFAHTGMLRKWIQSETDSQLAVTLLKQNHRHQTFQRACRFRPAG